MFSLENAAQMSALPGTKSWAKTFRPTISRFHVFFDGAGITDMHFVCLGNLL
jgi:hypothetical protein